MAATASNVAIVINIVFCFMESDAFLLFRTRIRMHFYCDAGSLFLLRSAFKAGHLLPIWVMIIDGPHI